MMQTAEKAPKFRFVCATRSTVEGFQLDCALGRTLDLYRYPQTEIRLFPNNTVGLPRLYNMAIQDAARDPAILIFAHDDLFICDFFWPDHIRDGLENFDIVGLAGNRRRVANQPAWPFTDTNLTNDVGNLSGTVAHGSGFPPENLSHYGPVGCECKLLDGVLLAAHSSTLLANNVLFDERFDFHHYDLDFCRQAETQGLKMGTCAVSAIHESLGHYGSDDWLASHEKYSGKWGE
jgi:hypothetical protein